MLNRILEKFPITDGTLFHAKWIDIQKRTDANWESIEFFLSNFSSLFSNVNLDELYDEFCDYKTLTNEEISDHNYLEQSQCFDWSVDDRELFHYRVQTLCGTLDTWSLLNHLLQDFQMLKVAELVLPHSNARKERLFSKVSKNKTDSRSSLRLDGTLSNLFAMKLQYPDATTPCFKVKFGQSTSEYFKKVTTVYHRGVQELIVAYYCSYSNVF